jgi:3-mercaptopyruvate sulfurtransferase SseA
MKTKFLYLSLISLLFFACNAQTSKNIEVVSAIDYSHKILATSKAQIIDVRTPEEFESGHIDNAKNIDWLCFIW